MRRVLSEINVHFFRGPNEVSDEGKSIYNVIIFLGGDGSKLDKNLHSITLSIFSKSSFSSKSNFLLVANDDVIKSRKSL